MTFKYVNRALFLIPILVMVCLVYFISPRFKVFLAENSQESTENGYKRDFRGYLYPNGYFQMKNSDKSRLFHNISLKGRNSNYVLPECNHPDGVHIDLELYKSYNLFSPFKYLKNFKNPCWYENGNQSTLRCIPYFYFLGTTKAGTTDLYFRIAQHPHIIGNITDKEYRWFDSFRFLDRGKAHINYYIHQFDNATEMIRKDVRADTSYHYKIMGDGTPSTLMNSLHWAKMPGNEKCMEPRVLSISYIHSLYPKAKLILIVRNPVDRLYSHFLYTDTLGINKTKEVFHDWAKNIIKIYTDCFKSHPMRRCLYSSEMRAKAKAISFVGSIYSRLLLDVLKLFPRNQLFVLQTEDYSANMADRLQDVFRFLGLDPLSKTKMNEIVGLQRRNKGGNYDSAGPMLPKTRKMIHEFYKPFNEELAEILNDDKYLWREK